MRKAITPIISIIVLLLITIALVGGGWLYISGYFETMMKAIDIPLGSAYCRGNEATVVIRNPGQSPINNSDRKAMLGLFHDDEDAVGAWRFEGDGSTAADSSGQGNVGSIYGDTVLLMHFEGEDNATLDSTSYGNDGSIYGDTVLLMHFDEDDGAVTWDESNYGNDGAIYGNTKLLMHFDEGVGNPMDSSPYGNDGARIGTTWTSNCQSGSCLEFNGNDYVRVNDDSSLSFGDGIQDYPFSISLWVKSFSIGRSPWIISKYKIGHGFEREWWVRLDSNGYPIFGILDESVVGGNTAEITALSGLSADWHHLVVTYDGRGGNNAANGMGMYVDGSEIGISITLPGANYQAMENGGEDVVIGAMQTFGGLFAFFNGIIDEVAIYSKALSQEEITAMHNEGRAKFTDWIPGKSGSALEFDGQDDYVEVPDNDVLDFGFSSFSIGSWFKTSSNAEFLRIIDKYVGGTSDPSGYLIQIFNGKIRTSTKDNSSNSILLTSSASVNDGSWHHVFLVINRENSHALLYLDGELINSLPTAFNDIITNNLPLYIGVNDGILNWFNGIIDEVAIYNRSLTQEEIKAHYRAGRAKFIERTSGKSGAGIEFDGVDDYVEVQNHDSLNPSQLTVSVWAKSNTVNWNASGMLVSKRDAYIVSPIFNLISPTKQVNYYIYDTTWRVTSVIPADITTWHMYTFTYNGTHITGYLDGARKNIAGPYGSINTADTGVLTIGRDDGYDDRYFNGSIDEVAIYSRSLTADEVNDLYEAGRAKFIERGKLGRFGYGIEFDGVNDYVDLGDTQINSVSQFSLSLWMKWNEEDNMAIFAKEENDTSRIYLYAYASGNILSFYLNKNSDSNIRFNYISKISTDKWHHIFYTFDGSGATNADKLKVYLDGTIETTAYFVGDIPSLTPDLSDFNTLIGDNKDSNRPFNGTIDEVVILNTALSPQDIQAQLTPACSCSGNTCQCGELIITRTAGEGYFHPYFDSETISPKGSVRMTDYNCLSDSCTYRITSVAASVEATVECS